MGMNSIRRTFYISPPNTNIGTTSRFLPNKWPCTWHAKVHSCHLLQNNDIDHLRFVWIVVLFVVSWHIPSFKERWFIMLAHSDSKTMYWVASITENVIWYYNESQTSSSAVWLSTCFCNILVSRILKNLNLFFCIEIYHFLNYGLTIFWDA
jgi:hypothetical protein